MKKDQTALELFVDDETPSNVYAPAMSRLQNKIVNAAVQIGEAQPDMDELDFVHASFAQVALPRRRVEGGEFQRRFGGANIHIQAGVLNSSESDLLVRQPLPYGLRPRQLLIYATTYARQHHTTEIPLGRSLRDLMITHLGYKSASGGARGVMTSLREQLRALVACRITLGWSNSRGHSMQKMDIFSGLHEPRQWLNGAGQQELWPGVATLTKEYLESSERYAFPVDRRAIQALESALSMDIYCWMAYRLWRLTAPLSLSWSALRLQFGQDYADRRDFKKVFNHSLRQVCTVYPDARIESESGGLIFKPSPPPVRSASIVLPA